MILIQFNEHIAEQADHDSICQGEDAGKYRGVVIELYDTHVVRCYRCCFWFSCAKIRKKNEMRCVQTHKGVYKLTIRCVHC